MPHIAVEYADEPDVREKIDDVIDAIMDAANQSPIVVIENLKLRAIGAQHYRVSGRKAPFVHVTVKMMTGPSLGDRKNLSDALFTAVDGVLPHVRQITVDVRSMDPDTYRKR